MNLITKLLLVVGKDIILVVCDKLLKMEYFLVIIEETLAKRLAQLFRDNMWKLHGLLESVISDKRPQLVMKLTKKLNKILEIETKLSISFYLQTDEQTEQMNQELEQYLQFFIDQFILQKKSA